MVRELDVRYKFVCIKHIGSRSALLLHSICTEAAIHMVDDVEIHNGFVFSIRRACRGFDRLKGDNLPIGAVDFEKLY